MDARASPKGLRISSPRGPRGALSRSLLASTTLHATVLGTGLLWGLWTIGGRPPARVYTATFAAPETFAAATHEREVLDPSEPEDPPEPVLRESEAWSEPTPSSDVLERPEPEPARRSVDWVASRPFAIGTLAAHEEPAPLELPPPASTPHVDPVAPAPLLVSEPVPLEVPPPLYPRLARCAGEEGSVLCRLALDTDRKSVV